MEHLLAGDQTARSVNLCSASWARPLISVFQKATQSWNGISHRSSASAHTRYRDTESDRLGIWRNALLTGL